MDSFQELEAKISENISFIVEVAKEEKRLGDMVDEDEQLSDLKAAMLDSILLHEKIQNFKQAVKLVQNEANSGNQNLEDALMEHFEALNKNINDNLTEHQSYKNLLSQFSEESDVPSPENIDGDTENSMMMSHEIDIPLDPLTKEHLVDPVVNKICKHLYERDAIMHYIADRKKNARCPVSGCGNNALLQPGILEDDVKMRRLIEGRKRGDASFF